MEEKIVISLGGSLIVPEDIDVEFLKEFRELLSKFPNYYFIIAPGGGRTSRKYAVALQAMGNSNTEDSDWLGIYSIWLNSFLLSFAFRDLKNVKVMKNETAKPGQTSDFHAVEYAKLYSAKTVVNLSNIDHVYDKDPREYKDAKPLPKVSWMDFRKIIGDKWEANKSWPFDPAASKSAEELKLKVVFMNGKPLQNLSGDQST